MALDFSRLLRFFQRNDWINAAKYLVDNAGGGGYASLTGPGQTATPGALTQTGGYTVDDTTGNGVYLHESGAAGGIFLVDEIPGDPTGASGGINLIEHSAGGIFISNDGTGPVTIEQSAPAGITINSNNLGGTGPVNIGAGGVDVEVTSNGGITLHNGGTGPVIINDTGAGGITLASSGANVSLSTSGIADIHLNPTGSGDIHLQLGTGHLTVNLPTSNPGGSGRLWNNAGVLNIT